jgi:hypothetical protein
MQLGKNCVSWTTQVTHLGILSFDINADKLAFFSASICIYASEVQRSVGAFTLARGVL